MTNSTSKPGGKGRGGKVLRDKAALVQRLQKLAEGRGGQLEAGQIYINNGTPLTFVDKSGNRFSLTPVELTQQNLWSPFETLEESNILSAKIRKRKFAPKERNVAVLVQRLVRLAQSHGGYLEEGQTYVDVSTPLFFVDKAGNRFPLKPQSLLRNAWSPFPDGASPTAKKRRKSSTRIVDKQSLYQRLVDMAKSKGGKLLEGQTYVDSHTPLRFVDKADREFSMKPNLMINLNLWSPHESKGTHDVAVRMERLLEKIKEWNGRIAPGEIYKGYATKMKFIDSEGNEFSMIPSMVMNGWWSPYQSKMIRDKDAAMARLRKAVEVRGGKIEEGQAYQGGDTPMWFIDSYGDRFQQTPSRITSEGRWNPEEGGLIGESVCRQAIAHLFGGSRFPSKWNVVRRPNGNKLQLDGYNEQLGIAFEYQGYLHETNELQIARDKEKRAACLVSGILLIEIPELAKAKLSNSDHVLKTIAKIVKSSLLRVGRSLEASGLREEGLKLDFSKIRVCDQRLDALREFVAEHHPGWSIEEGQPYERHDVPLWLRNKAGLRVHVTPALIQRRAREKKPPLPAKTHKKA